MLIPPPKQSTLQLGYAPPRSSVSFSTVVMPTSQGMGLSWWRSGRGDQLMSRIVPTCTNLPPRCVPSAWACVCLHTSVGFLLFSSLLSCWSLYFLFIYLFIFALFSWMLFVWVIYLGMIIRNYIKIAQYYYRKGIIYVPYCSGPQSEHPNNPPPNICNNCIYFFLRNAHLS